MQKNFLLLFVLGISCASIVRSQQPSWANLSGLKVGQKIQVVEFNAKKHSGTFESASDSAIIIRDASGEASLQKQDVRSVELLGGNRRLRHTLIGAGVGAGAGAAICAGAWESRGFLGGKGTGAAVGAVIGVLSGSIVGAALPAHDKVYGAPSH